MSIMSSNVITRRRRFSLALLLLALLALSATLTSLIWFSDWPSRPMDDSQIAAPLTVWQAQAVEDYRFTLQISCFCLPEVRRPVTIEVNDGAAVSFTYADDGTAADPRYFQSYDSIDKIFAILTEAEAEQPAQLNVTFDEATGVPSAIFIDIDEMMADEELNLSISAFEALPGA